MKKISIFCGKKDRKNEKILSFFIFAKIGTEFAFYIGSIQKREVEQLRGLWSGKRNWVLIGEAGCGKTEAAMYLAQALHAEGNKRVNLIDMDQTKGMFRARDFSERLNAEGITTVEGMHFMDMPVVPPGVERLLADQEAVNVLDVGGNEIGAVAIGQFARKINTPDTAVLYLINPYRNFSGTTENIRILKENIQNVGGIRDVSIIANPNFGRNTTEQDILEGYDALLELLEPLGLKPMALIIPDWVDEAVFAHLQLPKWILKPYIKYP